MGIFYRRPLCLFCACFFTGALAAWLLPSIWVLRCLVVLLALLAAAAVLCLCFRRRAAVLLTVMLCLAGLFGSMAHAYATVDLPVRHAGALVGRHAAELLIVEQKAQYADASVYAARLVCVDGAKENIMVKLTDRTQSHLESGDRVWVTAELSAPTDAFGEPLERHADGYALCLALDGTQEAYVQRFSLNDLRHRCLSLSDIRILAERAQDRLQSTFAHRLGDEVGALASAFLLGDRSALSTVVIRDFRRAGLSHVMAVSGLHISVLLGGLDRVLRCLYLPKRARIAAVAVSGGIFLFLTGFSLSGVRSVLMLFSVYLHFLLREENDSLTALFVSIVLILLLSPYAVADVGMWMSFLATLGLLTVYPWLEARIPVPRSEQKGAALLRLGRKVALLLGMTVVANLFLLPILWLLFGELSVVAPLSNLLLALPTDLFLWLLPVVLGLGWLPWVGAWLCRAVMWCGQGIIRLTAWFSQTPHATISLQDTVCRWTVPLLCLTLAVLLTVRVRNRKRLWIPLGAVSLVFVCGLGIAGWQQRQPTLWYCQANAVNEYFFAAEGQTLSICDVSGGSATAYAAMTEQYAAMTATEIRAFVLTHYHAGHAEALPAFLQSTMVRTLYLPLPEDAQAVKIADTLVRCAEAQGTEVKLYRNGEVLSLTDSTDVRVEWQTQPQRHAAVGLELAVGTYRLSYLSANALPTADFAQQSRAVLLGSHGTGQARTSYGDWRLSEQTEVLLYAARSTERELPVLPPSTRVYVPQPNTEAYTVRFPFS